MVIKVRKVTGEVERKKRPKEQQDALAGGELPSPDFVPSPTMQESMDMFRRQRAKDIQDAGGRSPQSTSDKDVVAPVTQKQQSLAVLKMHIKTAREMGYDDETIKANMPNTLLNQLNEMEARQRALQQMGMPVDKQDILDIRNERQKLQDTFFAPVSGEEPEMERIDKEIRGETRRDPASGKRKTNAETKREEFESGKLRLDSIYYPAGHDRAGELTQHGQQRMNEITAGSREDITRRDNNGKK